MNSSRRAEERNEKIIRGLMKLPPNTRCINCNAMGPQYVCTNFWTFTCTTCSGLHREFTHRVKSVSMAKFTSQEVDALQKGGNQRARELFFKAWDPQRNRLPDNSNIDKLRQFIKDVYIDKKYSLEKSSDRPPRDPQSLRSQEDEVKRASSYHSYSQSPPYDFQYEERHHGKHAASFPMRVGSDHGLYDGKHAGFLSPTHLSDDGIASEGSFSQASEYSTSGGGDASRSDFFSPSPIRDTGSSCSDTSREISSKHSHAQSDASSRSIEGRMLHQQSVASSGSIGSFDRNSVIKSVNFLRLPEVGSACGQATDDTLRKASSFPSLLHSSDTGKDLVGTPFSSKYITTTSPTGSNSQFRTVSLAKSVNKVMQPSNSSVPTLALQQPSQTPQPAPVDMFAAIFERQSRVPQISPSPQPPPVDLFDTLSQQHSKLPQTSHNPQPSPVYLFDTLSHQHSKIPQTSPTPQLPPHIDLFDTLSQKHSKIPEASHTPQPPAVNLSAASQPQSSMSSLDLFTSQQQLEIAKSSQISRPQPGDLLVAPQQQACAPESVQTHTPQPPPFDLFCTIAEQQSAESSNRKASDVVKHGNGGWATFNMPQNIHMDSKNSVPLSVPSSVGYASGNFNPFLPYPGTYQHSTGLETSVSTHAFRHENVQTSEVTPWSAFDSPAGGQINRDVLKCDEKSAFHGAFDANKSLSLYETQSHEGNLRAPSYIEHPSPGVSSHSSTLLNDFPVASAMAGAHSLVVDHKPINPFETSDDSDRESSSTSGFWDMSSLQSTLPNTQMPTSDVSGLDESWFPQNPGGVSFDSTSVSLEFLAVEAKPAQTVKIQHSEGPTTSSGGGVNPFA